MADEPKPVVVVSPPDEVVADTAALAANSAERAQAAAQDAIQNAQQAAAGVAAVAAEETRQTEERLAEWQGSLVRQHESLASRVVAHEQATQAKLAEAMDAILSIQNRLPVERASPPSPSHGSSGETPPEDKETKPPAEPKPERKRAHRWI